MALSRAHAELDRVLSEEYVHESDEGMSAGDPMETTDDPVTTDTAEETAASEDVPAEIPRRRKRLTKAEKAKVAFDSSVSKQENLHKPDWDGIHGRLCHLLPAHCQFAFRTPDESTTLPTELVQAYPEKPARMPQHVEHAYTCGLLDDETRPIRHKKSGKRTSVAGTPAKMRTNVSDKAVYTLTDSGGSVVAAKNVLFC